MEGRPPPFDPDDDLEFDFDTSSHRQVGGTGDWASDLTEEESPADREPESSEIPGEGGADAGRRRRGKPRRGGALGGLFGRRGRSRREPSTAERSARRTETGEYGVAGPDEPGTGDDAAAEPGTGERRLRDDPFTPARVPVPGERRSRRRDLPAKVRRRQAIGIGALAVVILGGGAVLFAGGSESEEEPEIPIKRVAGQAVIGKMGQDGPDRPLLQAVRKGQIGGVIVVPRDEQVMVEGVTRLQRAAADGGNPPLLIMIDQEGGSVKRLPGPPELSAQELGREGDPEAARAEGAKTGEYLKRLGANVDLAPVLDVELPQTADTIADRTFGDDAAVVAEMGAAFAQGLQSQGVAATGKHFPGLGPATVNTDFAPVEVVARQEVLDAALTPFQTAIDAGVQLIMVSSAIYPAYVPENPKDPNKPASSARPIVQRMLREGMGFGGVIITDDLESIAIQELDNPQTAGLAAMQAGCDLILYATSRQGAFRASQNLVRAEKQGKITREQLEAAYERVTSLKSALGAA